jgi:cell division protein FtsW
MVVAARIPYTVWQRWSIVLMGGAILGLMAVIPFGADLHGAKRTFFGGSVQPSEPAKIITILYASAWLASKGARIRDVRAGLLPFSMLMGIVAVLIILQPEISAAILIVATASIMFFIAGAELKQIGLIGIGAGLTFWLVIINSSYAGGRLERYLDSLANPLQSAEYQVQHSVGALVRGGPAGVGIGNSLAHTLDYFLPLSWSDNVFAIIGEELGLLGALLVILLFALLAYRGLRIALRAPDSFGMLTALGITSLLILQALLNIGVVVAATPPTGVTLPFISYGGSSLVTALGAIGILLSISYYSGRNVGQGTDLGTINYARFNFGWRNRGARLSRPGRRRPVAAGGGSRRQ